MTSITTAFRAHNVVYAGDPTSGNGAKLYGGRFNKPGKPALYLALSYQTAMLEVLQHLPNKFVEPTVIVQYHLEFSDLVDLTDKKNWAAWGVTSKVLKCPWEDLSDRLLPVPSWDLADRMSAASVAGILVPSFAYRAGPNDKNLVLWNWSNRRPHKIVAHDPNGRLNKIKKPRKKRPAVK